MNCYDPPGDADLARAEAAEGRWSAAAEREGARAAIHHLLGLGIPAVVDASDTQLRALDGALQAALAHWWGDIRVPRYDPRHGPLTDSGERTPTGDVIAYAQGEGPGDVPVVLTPEEWAGLEVVCTSP